MSRLTKTEPYVRILFAALIALTIPLPVLSAEVEIRMVQAMQSDGLWKFKITVYHPDSGADHMYNSVAIFTPDETRIGYAEIPTPSIGADTVTTQVLNVDIPEELDYIVIRGKCTDYSGAQDGIMIALR